jgi:hypothetical protein
MRFSLLSVGKVDLRGETKLTILLRSLLNIFSKRDLFIIGFFTILGMGGVFAAGLVNLTPVESQGAGYSAATVCDPAITIRTENQFLNNVFTVSTISITDLDSSYPNGCGSSVLDLTFLANETLVNTTFSIAPSNSNNTYQFGGSIIGNFRANTILTPFEGAGLASLAVSIYKVPLATYSVGQVGPGGGIVFYVSSTGFTCGATLTESCNYLEAAPTTGSTSWSDRDFSAGGIVGYKWSGDTANSTPGTTLVIGAGYKNTLAMITQSNTTGKAGTAARDYRGPNNLSDWYLPSKDELNQMCKWARGVPWVSDATVCTGGTLNTGSGAAGFYDNYYWSSSQSGNSRAWYQFFVDPYNSATSGRQAGDLKTTPAFVRPIRAF